MKKNFHILGTVEPKGTKKSDKSSLQFHIQLDTGQEAYMRYQTAKKKYAGIFLEYLVEKAIKVSNSEDIIDIQQQMVKNQSLEKSTQKGRESSQLTSSKIVLEKYFHVCGYCNAQNASNLLDYDAIVPADSTIAIPVYFKVKKQSLKKKSKNDSGKKGKYLKRK